MKPYSKEYGLALGSKLQALTWGRRSYIPSWDAPSTLPDLRAAFKIHLDTGAPFPVYRGGCETSIYGSAEANYAFRYLHDRVHAVTGEGFDLEGELLVARLQEHQLGYLSDEESLTFEVDTIGQALYSYISGGKFLEDQAQFVEWVYRETLLLQQRPAALGLNRRQHLQQAVYNYHQWHQ